MKKACIFLALLLSLAAMQVFAQDRSDTLIFVAPVKGSPEQAQYFSENFTMETIGAGYGIAKSLEESDYVIQLEVIREPGSPGGKPYTLQVQLLRSADNVELLSFSFPFSDLNEMYEYNLYLLYEALANAPPIIRGGNNTEGRGYTGSEYTEEDDLWRNKWLYIRVSLNYPIVTYMLTQSPPIIYKEDDHTEYQELDHKMRAVPGASFGVELQYLNWMSAEVVFDLLFGDPVSYAFIPGIGIQLKFPIKPSRHYMLEPYLMGKSTLNTSVDYITYPFFGAGAGFQFGVKAGDSGAAFVDVNFVYSIGELVTKNMHSTFTEPKQIHWRTWTIGLGIGYKAGFFDRNK
jgi:hypothetical protein